jgi:hypothetical protein
MAFHAGRTAIRLSLGLTMLGSTKVRKVLHSAAI